MPVSIEPATRDRSGPTNPAPAVNVDAMAGIEGGVDGVEDRLHLLGVFGDAYVRDWKPPVFNRSPRFIGDLREKLVIRAQFAFFGEIDEKRDPCGEKAP